MIFSNIVIPKKSLAELYTKQGTKPLRNHKKYGSLPVMTMTVTPLNTADHPQFMDHEAVYKIHDADQNITAYIGVHNSALGPALGGIRYKAYENEHEALSDVLRLSEAMTWKNAAGGLKHGGGKSVIVAKNGTRSPDEQTLRVFAAGLNEINKHVPTYFGAEDMNINEAALDSIQKTCPWIKGGTPTDPAIVAGSPSPITARGVYECMKVAIRHKLGKDSLNNVKISMQGLGAVGREMARYLHKDGAILTGADISDAPFETLKSEGVEIRQVALDTLYDEPADIFAPNAIGGTINDETIPRLKAAGVQIICGAANNQQSDQRRGTQSKTLHRLGILYCPDYIVNAAGVIWVSKVGEDRQSALNAIHEGVPRRFQDVLSMAATRSDTDLATLASEYARRRVEAAELLRDKPAQTG